MARILSFNSDYGSYSFPTAEQTLDDNFRSVRVKSDSLPGSDGGVDQFGTGYAPSAVGTITLSFYLVSPTLEGMQAKVDAANQMRGWGVGYLIYQPTDLTLPQRWAFCRVSNIAEAKDLKGHPDRFQLVTVTFQSNQPIWYTAGTEKLWNDGGKWDDSGLWDSGTGAPSPTSITNSGSLTVTPGGNVKTTGRVILKNSAGGAVSNPIIQRILNGEIVDQIKFWGSIASSDWLEIDPRAHRAMMGIAGSDQYDNCEFLTPNWLELLPNTSNTIQIYLSGQVDAVVRYMERYV